MTVPQRYALSTFATYRPASAAQADASDAAQAFVAALREHYRPRRLFRRRPPLPARGLYLVGPVGTGKTHLLAACAHALSPAVPVAFLRASTLFRTTEPPDAYAAALARRVRVVCIDEVEVDDPANEVRLVRTLKALDTHGVAVIATSNATPDAFVGAAFGGDRFQRFLTEFSAAYRVVVVPGDDYRARLARDGRAFVGPEARSRAALRRLYDAEPGTTAASEQDAGADAGADAVWLDWPDFVRLSRETEHTALVDRLAEPSRLYLAGLAPASTDDALRLLRVLDDLYLRADAPTLFFSSEAPPEAWLAGPTGAMGGALERGIADKFQQFGDRVAKHRLVGQEIIAEPVDRLGLARHRPLRVEIRMIAAPGLDPVDHLDAADLDHPVAARRAQAGGLGIENDFTHDALSRAHDPEASEDLGHPGSGRRQIGASVDHEIGAVAFCRIG